MFEGIYAVLTSIGSLISQFFNFFKGILDFAKKDETTTFAQE